MINDFRVISISSYIDFIWKLIISLLCHIYLKHTTYIRRPYNKLRNRNIYCWLQLLIISLFESENFDYLCISRFLSMISSWLHVAMTSSKTPACLSLKHSAEFINALASGICHYILIINIQFICNFFHEVNVLPMQLFLGS